MIKPFYIDYPQEHFEGQPHRYRCVFCKQETTHINGRLEGHLATCDYRVQMEKCGYEVLNSSTHTELVDADEFD